MSHKTRRKLCSQTAVERTAVRHSVARDVGSTKGVSLVITSVVSLAIWLLVGDVAAGAAVLDGACTDANAGDASCIAPHASNDDGSSRVPEDCQLVMAPSGIANGGWGMFTLAPRSRGQRVSDQGDIIIHLPDPNPRNAHEMRRLIWDYLWDGQLTGGHYEGSRVMSVSAGFGSLANGLSNNGHNLIHDHSFPFVDNAGLQRGRSPGAGSVSHHYNFTWITNRDLSAGDELLVEYGAGWFKERGHDGSASPAKIHPDRLREVGYCLDNIVFGPSLIEEAGRGAFASRDLEEGAIVAPVPLVPLSRSSLKVLKERNDGSAVLSTQLLQNYCYGHQNSSLLLFPYVNGVNFINHSKNPNVQLRWSKGSSVIFHKPLLELQQSSHSASPMLELVATRKVDKGEELHLDYGDEWEQAWNKHVSSWQPRDEDIQHVSAETMNNDDSYLVLRTHQEQQLKPYPPDVFTSCYYKYSPDGPNPATSDSVPDRSAARWKPEMITLRNLRPCMVVRRDEVVVDNFQTHVYTVHVMNRPTLNEAQRIPKGHMHFATHVPRHAILFSDKTYTSDQHLGHAFRKEISLGEIFPDQWKDIP